MAMLAEPRRKGKYSVDPRGLNWSKDEEKFGQKLMEKMGWQKGKGLGANEDGKVDHVAVKLKSDNRGVGCTKSHGDNWIAHQDDFNSLLAQLNSDHGIGSTQDSGEDSATDKVSTDKVTALEERSKNSKGRVHYHKFAKGKDLSSCKESDFDAIFGRRKNKSNPSTPTTTSEVNSGNNSETEKEEGSPLVSQDTDSGNITREEHTHGITTITNSTSVADYFAQKMAALKAKRAGIVNDDTKGNLGTLSDKTQTVDNMDEEVIEKTSEIPQEDCNDVKKKKKKSKKNKKDKRTVSVSISEEAALKDGTNKTGDIKKRKLEEGDQEEESTTSTVETSMACDTTTGDSEPKKKKRKKEKSKKKNKDLEVIETSDKLSTVDSEDSLVTEITKKSKKNRDKKQKSCENVPDGPAKCVENSDDKVKNGKVQAETISNGKQGNDNNFNVGFKGANVEELSGYSGIVITDSKKKKKKKNKVKK